MFAAGRLFYWCNMKTISFPDELKRVNEFTTLQAEGFIKGNLVMIYIRKGYTEMQAKTIASTILNRMKGQK